MTLQTNTNRHGNGKGNLTYLLIGGGIGAAVALLFAPKSGSELRHDIADVTKKGYDGTLDIARKVKDESSNLYRTLLDRSHDVFETASNTLGTTANKAQNAADGAVNASKTMDSAVERASDDVSHFDAPRRGNGGRRPSKIL